VRCAVCRSARRDEIDRLLLSGTTPPEIELRYRVKRSMVITHLRGHLPERLSQVVAAQEAATAEALYAKLLGLEAEAKRLGDLAELKGDIKTAGLLKVREVARLWEFVARLAGLLKEQPIVSQSVSYTLVFQGGSAKAVEARGIDHG
jgi:hypothetical protein